jgi:hypothetical protein
MICFDIENEDIFRETIAEKPIILFNPTWIPAPKTKTTDLFLSDWRVAMETMSRKFEALCTQHNVTIIRCDIPLSSSVGAMGTSQVITPYRTVYAPTFEPTSFSTFIEYPYV